MTQKDKIKNFIVCADHAEANLVDAGLYRWSERMSAKTGNFVFVKRVNAKVNK